MGRALQQTPPVSGREVRGQQCDAAQVKPPIAQPLLNSLVVGQDSVLSIGTYLTPKTYVGYGYNLLESTSQFNTLYTITPRYGVEASVGEADNNLNAPFTYER